MTKEQRKRITEEVQTEEIAGKLRELANTLEAENGKRGVTIGKQGWENLVDAVAEAQLVGETVKAYGKEAVLTLQEYVQFADGCSTKHLYGNEYDIEIKQDTEISKKFDKEKAIAKLLSMYGVTEQGITELLAVLSVSVKKLSDLEGTANAPVVAVLKDNGYAIENKEEVTVSKPKFRSKRSAGKKAVATSHNREEAQA